MPAEEQQDTSPEPKKRRRIPKTLVIVIAVATVEAVGFYGVTKLFGGGPQVAHGAEEGEGHLLDGEDPGSVPVTAEVAFLSDFRVPNSKNGRLYTYNFDIAVKVAGRRQEEMKALVAERKNELSDRVARIVRAADPPVLNEPELKTLRMQIKHEIGAVAGDQDLVLEVLIPRCQPIRSD
jgi:flagellar basal body-associated protein FliL